jgi:hypothetical protein
MAQTRVIGKVCRNKFAFVMKMAGYEATPAEEMTVEIMENQEPTTPLGGVARQYEKFIAEAKNSTDTKKVLRQIKAGYENKIINQETYDDLLWKIDEKNKSFEEVKNESV